MFLNRYKNFDTYWKRIRVKDDSSEGSHSKFVYVEDYYHYDFDDDVKNRIKRMQIQLALCFVIVFGFSVTRQVSINSIPYIGGFAMIAAAAELFCIIGIFSFIRIEENMTIMDFKRVRGMIYYSAAGVVFALSALFAGYFYYLFTQHPVITKMDFLVAAGYIFAILLEIPILLFQSRKHYKVILNNKMDKREIDINGY